MLLKNLSLQRSSLRSSLQLTSSRRSCAKYIFVNYELAKVVFPQPRRRRLFDCCQTTPRLPLYADEAAGADKHDVVG